MIDQCSVVPCWFLSLRGRKQIFSFASSLRCSPFIPCFTFLSVQILTSRAHRRFFVKGQARNLNSRNHAVWFKLLSSFCNRSDVFSV